LATGKEAAMLILTRRPGETLVIELPTGEQIKVTVLDVKGNQVRIGTDAPGSQNNHVGGTTMKSRLLNAVRTFTLGILFISASGQAATVLVSHPVANAHGYGSATWTNMTNTLDSATNNSVTVVSLLNDFGQMLHYDAIWVDSRGPSGSLSTAETANITNYISTGRRVVMMGENDS